MESKTVEKNAISTIQYFTFFEYPPNFDEIHTFYPLKISKADLQNNLNKLQKKHKILAFQDHSGTIRYTPGGYTKLQKEYRVRTATSGHKLKSTRTYIELLKKLPQIKLVGLSGSVSMNNAKGGDDVDLFVVTTRNRLWTGRFLALITASLFGRRRKRKDMHVDNKICLNLFFDEGRLKILPRKQSYFVAHEVLQMKPRVDKDLTHSRFLEANAWVFKHYPNAHAYVRRRKQISPSRPALPAGRQARSRNDIATAIGDLFELLLKKFQLSLINRHKTTELILPGQLWFFPDDFEKKIKIKELRF